jgi:hypothetical protein
MEIARRLDLTAWERMMRIKRTMRMPTMERMPLHPLLPRHHLLHPLLPHLRRSMMKALWRWSLSKKHELILVDIEPEMPQLCLYHALMRDYEESLPRMMDDFDDLDDDPNEGRSNMDEWSPEDGSNDRDWVIKSKS